MLFFKKFVNKFLVIQKKVIENTHKSPSTQLVYKNVSTIYN